MRNLIKSNWPSFLILIGMAAFAIYLSPQLPESLPTHWNIHGEADQYSNKIFALSFLPLLSLGLVILLGNLGAVSPEKFRAPNSRSAIEGVAFAATVFFATLYVGTVLVALKPGEFYFEPFFAVGAGLFLIVTGNFLSKVSRNFLIGIRVPWTLASEKNWKATHRFAARVMVAGGFLLLLSLSVTQSMPVVVCLICLSCGIPVIYSYQYFRRHEKQS